MVAEYGIMKKSNGIFAIGNLADASIIKNKPIAQFVDTQKVFQIKAHIKKYMSIGGVFGNIQGSRIAAIASVSKTDVG